MNALKLLIAGVAFLALPLLLSPKPAAGSSLVDALPGIVEGVATVVDAFANDDALDVFAFEVVGNVVSADPILDVPSDPGVWELEQGETVLAADGTFTADLLGLSVDGLVASNIEVGADIFCEGVLVHSTPFFLTDEFGDVLMDDFVNVPSCFDPTILFVNADEFWIAVGGNF